MKNFLTQWETKEENQKIIKNVDRKVVDKKHSHSVLVKKPPNPVGKLRKKTKRSLESDRKIVDQKPPNLVGVLRRKTDALYIRLQLRGVGLKGEVGAWKKKFR